MKYQYYPSIRMELSDCLDNIYYQVCVVVKFMIILLREGFN